MKRNLNNIGSILLIVGLPITFIILIILMTIDIGNDIDKASKLKDSYVGKTVVINNDTLMIVRRGSVFSDFYYLSNNTRVNQIVVDKTIIK